MTKEEYATIYDAGYTNALLQLKVHINSYVPKPNSQLKKAFEVIDIMLEVCGNEEKYL